jgi:hypothetical protein
MQYVWHAVGSVMTWVEHFGPKHWLWMLLLALLFGYFCMTGLNSRVRN